MADIKPYSIDVPQEKLDSVQKKLALTTLPDELDHSGWEYGAPLRDIKRLLKRWQDGYNWRDHEATLNQFPQFTTDIEPEGFESLNIHFIHQKSDAKNAIPLLFVHGWPGHIQEVTKILPLLVKGGKESPAFDVVAPSLPNYGFSEGVSKKGFGIQKYAEVCHKLMLKLGYDKYVTQGGDWGYFITRAIAMQYSEHAMATHVNMTTANPPSCKNPLLAAQTLLQAKVTGFSQEDQHSIDQIQRYRDDESGYFYEQATKPQTLGYSQADSPVGLLAWIYEKLHTWTDDYPWTDDEVLTWVSIYAYSRAGPTAASRIYYEMRHDPEKIGQRVGQWVPGPKLGISRFPKEILMMPKLWWSSMGPLVFQGSHDKGGHFAAYERPQELVSDVKTMFGKGGGAYGVVPGKDGYEGASSRL